MNDATKGLPFQLIDDASRLAGVPGAAVHESLGEPEVIYATEQLSVDHLIAALNVAGAELERARRSADTARSTEAAALAAVNALQARLSRSIELVRATQPRGTDWQLRGNVALRRE